MMVEGVKHEAGLMPSKLHPVIDSLSHLFSCLDRFPAPLGSSPGAITEIHEL
jgi:hypothetical protein